MVLRNKGRLIIALCCAAAAALGIFLFLRNSAADTAALGLEEDLIEVCVASRDIAVAERIDEDDLRVELRAAKTVPASAIVNREDAIGSYASSLIVKNEVLSAQRLNSQSSLDVPAGMSAVSVPVKETQAVGAAVNRGSMVDVYLAGDSAVSLIAQRVLVLETNLSCATVDGSRSSGSLSWVTLAVDASHVEGLIAASKSGKLYFALPSSQTQADKDE